MTTSTKFSIESGVFLAPSLATIPCRFERVESYEEKIPEYQGQDFTYIPMPYDEKYYNTEEGWLRDIDPAQYIGEDSHLVRVLEKLQKYPFLLLDYRVGTTVQLYDGDLLLPEYTIEEFSIDSERVISYEESLGIEVAESEVADFDYGLHQIIGSSEEGVETALVEEIREMDDEGLLEALNEAIFKFIDYDRFGIITISDLNRRPMKEMIYRALSELEIRISKNIENTYDDSRRLFKSARPDTIGRWEKDQIEGLGLHIAEYMTIIELQQSLKMSDLELVNKCGFESKDDVDDLSSINSLRNKVMHANRTLVHNRRDIGKLLDELYRIEEIINSASKVDHW